MSNISNPEKKKVDTLDNFSSKTNRIAVSELTLSYLSEINHDDILITSIKKSCKIENKIPLKLQHPNDYGRLLLSYRGPKFTDYFPPHGIFKVTEILLKKATLTSGESSLGDIHDGHWDVLHIITQQKKDCDYLFKKAISEKYTVILTIVLEIIDVHSSQQLVLYLNGVNGTPLHRAVAENDMKITKTLLDCNLDVNAQDKGGWTPLLVAVDAENSDVVNLLINNGADINVKNNQNQTPLHYAAERNNKDILNSFLQNKVKLNKRDNNGQTPLFYAVAAENLNVIDILLKKGADCKLTDLIDYTPFHLAAEQLSLDIIEIFLKNNIDANILNSRRQTPLFYASKKPFRPQAKAFYKEVYPKIIHTLVKEKADINFQDSQGRTPFHSAVINDNIEFAQALFDCNADASIQDKLGKNVLHLACQYPSNKCILALLNFKIDINTVDIDKRTALHIAAKAKNYGAVELIMKNNPDINLKDKFNNTPLHLAIESECLSTIELLLKNKADVNLKDTLGKTALHVASMNLNINKKIIKSIINSTNDINCKDNSERTAVHLAALNHNFRTLEYLLEENADVNARDFQGKIPLHLSMIKPEKKYRSCLKCVKIFINNKANINAVDNNSASPLHLACFIKNAEVVKYLLENGADSNIRDKYGNTVFHYVSKLELNGKTLWIENVKKHTADTLNILIKETISINCVNKSGKTPLHHAVEEEFLFMNELLLNIGADINTVDADYNTAFDNLVERRNHGNTYNSTNDPIVQLYKKHMIKMKVMKLRIRKQSLEKIYNIDNKEQLKWAQSYEFSCQKEVDIMKLTNFDNSQLTYYVFLQKKLHDAINFTRNKCIVKAIQSNRLICMFPIYAHFLKSHLREVQQRCYLYEKIQERWQSYTFKKLPTCCMYEIFSYLGNPELDIFFEAIQPVLKKKS